MRNHGKSITILLYLAIPNREPGKRDGGKISLREKLNFMIFHSTFENSYLWLPLIGLVVGLLGTMIGGGGAFFFLPALTLLLGIPAHIAVATSLAASLPICMIGSLGHYQKGHTDIRAAGIFALAGIAGAFAGAGITRLLSAGNLKTAFGIYSVLIAANMILSNVKEKRNEARGKETVVDKGLKKISRFSAYGLLAGMITGTFGTSGTAPVMAGLFSIRMPLKQVVGTSMMVTFVNTTSALGAHFVVGEIDLTLVYFLTGGAVAGAFAGPRLLAGLKTDRAEAPVRQWYPFGMMFLGIVMIVT